MVAVPLVLVLVLALPAPAAALEQKLTASDGAAGDELGASVAVDGDTAVVGAHLANAGTGAVYIFTRRGDSWINTAKLTASDGAAGDELGASVAIDGDTIVAGAPFDEVGVNAGQGSVYTFARAGAAARSETAKLTASDGAAFDELGFSVAVGGETIVAGVSSADLGGSANEGSAYTFVRAGAAARSETAKLTASGGAADDQLGASVAVAGETIVAGAPGDNVGANADQGSASIFFSASPRPPSPQPLAPFAGCPALSANVIRGGAAGGRITGTARGDRIFAGAGDDIVDGLAGDDCIDLGPGADRGQGALGADLILGGLGNDRLSGSSGDDRLRGGPDPDRLNGGFGNDRLHGQAGRDRINGSRGRDRINGGSSNDVVSAGSSNDRVAGDQGSDRINGNSGNDSLKGNSGNDRITGSTGFDRIAGGSGNDLLKARDGRRDRVNCGRGRDTVIADPVDVVAGNCERVSRRR